MKKEKIKTKIPLNSGETVRRHRGSSREWRGNLMGESEKELSFLQHEHEYYEGRSQRREHEYQCVCEVLASGGG